VKVEDRCTAGKRGVPERGTLQEKKKKNQKNKKKRGCREPIHTQTRAEGTQKTHSRKRGGLRGAYGEEIETLLTRGRKIGIMGESITTSTRERECECCLDAEILRGKTWGGAGWYSKQHLYQ